VKRTAISLNTGAARRRGEEYFISRPAVVSGRDKGPGVRDNDSAKRRNMTTANRINQRLQMIA
jgi:hypothetical protein